MPRIIKSGLIQLSLPKTEGEGTIAEIKEAMVQKHIPYIEEAGKKGVQILCFQEIFNTPYFCPGQDKAWYESAETVPGPTIERMQAYAKKYNMVIIVPVYEKEQAGVLYNTAAVIDADGTYLGKYRKNHIPHTSGFWEKFFFKPGNLGYPVFQTQYAKVGVYICYDRHFPDGARCLGLNGAEIVYNPSATVAGLSQYLWKLEQPAHAAAGSSAPPTGDRQRRRPAAPRAPARARDRSARCCGRRPRQRRAPCLRATARRRQAVPAHARDPGARHRPAGI